ncbi:phosphopantetheine-binding protein [Streptomyces physcomitrii]|uniref:acyl carrier protein n=1 Tax=Streptomyces physcomitrii TaxID=2724184 RepID=UPI0033E24072
MTTAYEQLTAIVVRLHDAPADRISPEATFSDLDVDSLTMVEISMRVERELGVTIEDEELLPELSLGAAAELISARRTA